MQRDLAVSQGFDTPGPAREPQTGPLSGTRARIKVLDPMTSIGPSMEAELVRATDSDLQLRVPRWIIPGSVVQVLTPKGVVFLERPGSRSKPRVDLKLRMPCSHHAS